jgi:hypothetical protein
MNNKWFHAVSVICMLIICFAVVMAMYMLADGVDFNVPMKIQDSELITTQGVYHPGDNVEATFEYCKGRDIPGFVDWQLVDTYIRFYPAQRIDLPLGCHSYNILLGSVPSDVASESYHFTGTLTYKINSLTSVSYSVYSDTFTVVPG